MQPISFFLPGRVVPKARPRFNGVTAYLPENYRLWKSQASNIITQFNIPVISVPVAIDITIVGFKRGDVDNILGSIQDVLVDSGVLGNDGINQIPKASIEYQDSPKRLKGQDKLIGVLIRLSPHIIQRFPFQ